MKMTLPLRKAMLTTHVVVSIAWAGALAVFLAHVIVSKISADDDIVRAAWLMMAITTWLVILPLSLASVVTGIVQALGTAWGLVRHYWVVIKMLLTIFCTGVLLLKLAPIDLLASAARAPNLPAAEFSGLTTSLLVHAIGGLVLLLTIAALGILKPAALTRYGERKRRAEGGGAGSIVNTPRWVKVFGVVGIALAIALLLMLGHGEHGPLTHMHS